MYGAALILSPPCSEAVELQLVLLVPNLKKPLQRSSDLSRSSAAGLWRPANTEGIPRRTSLLPLHVEDPV